MYHIFDNFVPRVGLENPDLLGPTFESGQSEAAMTSGGPFRSVWSKNELLGLKLKRAVNNFVKRSRAFCMCLNF